MSILVDASFRVLGRLVEMLRVPTMLAGTSLADSPDDTEVNNSCSRRHLPPVQMIPLRPHTIESVGGDSPLERNHAMF